MRIEFTYQRDADYFEELFGFLARRVGRRCFVVGGLMGLAGAALLVLVDHGDVIGLGLLGWAAVLFVLGSWRYRRRPALPAPFHAPRRWVITDRGIESCGEQSDVELAWTVLRPMAELPRLFLFRHGFGTVIDVPREPLSAADDAMLRSLREHRGAASGRVDAAAGPSIMEIESGGRRWLITEEFIRMTATGLTHTWRWPTVHSVLDLPHAYLFKRDESGQFRHRPATATGLDVPRAALTTEQDAGLRAFLITRGLLPAGPGRPDVP